MESIEKIRAYFLGNPNYNSVQDLLKESFDTYTIGAYRSSYLTSYLAFLRQIRKKILEYPQNPFYQIIKLRVGESQEKYNKRVEKKWEDLLNNLDNDDKWEKSLQDALQEGEETNILFLTESDRNNFKFFRQKRNAAAHVKEGSTTASMVQVLWEFMQSYSKKIVVGGGKKTFLDMLETMGKFYDMGEIPEERISEINESFFLLSKYDQIDILREFYEKYKYEEISNTYMKHISQLFEGFFKYNREYFYQLLNEDTTLALFTTIVISDLDLLILHLDRKKVDQILNDSCSLCRKVRSFMKNNIDNRISGNISNFLNLLAMSYKGDGILPNTFDKIFSSLIERCLIQDIILIEDLEKFELNQEVKNKLISYMLDTVEESYSYHNGYRTVSIETFSWSNVSIIKYYIIYLSECTLTYPYPEKDRVDAVFSRLVILCNEYVAITNPDRDKRFLNNFNTMMDLLSSHDNLLLKIFNQSGNSSV